MTAKKQGEDQRSVWMVRVTTRHESNWGEGRSLRRTTSAGKHQGEAWLVNLQAALDSFKCVRESTAGGGVYAIRTRPSIDLDRSDIERIKHQLATAFC